MQPTKRQRRVVLHSGNTPSACDACRTARRRCDAVAGGGACARCRRRGEVCVRPAAVHRPDARANVARSGSNDAHTRSARRRRAASDPVAVQSAAALVALRHGAPPLRSGAALAAAARHADGGADLARLLDSADARPQAVVLPPPAVPSRADIAARVFRRECVLQLATANNAFCAFTGYDRTSGFVALSTYVRSFFSPEATMAHHETMARFVAVPQLCTAVLRPLDSALRCADGRWFRVRSQTLVWWLAAQQCHCLHSCLTSSEPLSTSTMAALATRNECCSRPLAEYCTLPPAAAREWEGRRPAKASRSQTPPGQLQSR